MGEKMKGILITVITIVLIVTLIGETIGDVSTAAAVVSDNASNPAILQLVFDFWYLPFVFLGIGLFLSTGTGKKVSKAFRRKRRR